jgi:glyoxylase-like metal-dependent hydrolase (beta-lactamase superfamily II)
VAPGVHRIPLPLPTDGLAAVNIYALVGPGGIDLIDGGWRVEPARTALRQGLGALGGSPADVRRCLVTHIHRDHYTLAADLRDGGWSGGRPEIALGVGERPNLAEIRRGGNRGMTGALSRLSVAGAGPLVDRLLATARPQVDPAEWGEPDRWLDDDEQVELAARTLRVLHTPGHTAGHVVFRDDDAGLLFAGDHVLPHITPSIGFEPLPVPDALADYLRSLAAVLSGPDRTLLPAHGPSGGSTHRRVSELLAHHEARLAATHAAAAVRPGAAYGIAQLLRWTRRERSFDELDLFNQVLAVNETLAHLVVLGAQGRADVAEADGVEFFTAR